MHLKRKYILYQIVNRGHMFYMRVLFVVDLVPFRSIGSLVQNMSGVW